MSLFSERDERWMARALGLAVRAFPHTSPNPMVGAVLASGDRLLSEGYHRRAGAPHAEVDCLDKIKGPIPKGAELYLTLEPCTHFGRTPPCADYLIARGVKRVAIAAEDPNPRVAGQGIRTLQRAGIAVRVGLCAREARRLNAAYFMWRTQGRPYVILKAALSLDGKVAMESGESQWISGKPARALAHQLRASVDAILVGSGTLRRDDPALTVRDVPPHLTGRRPLRVVLSSGLNFPLERQLFSASGPETLVFCAEAALEGPEADNLKARGVELVGVSVGANGKLDFSCVLAELGKRQVLSVLLEGGPTLYSSAMESGAVDAMALFLAPIVLGQQAVSLFPGWGGASLKGAAHFKMTASKRVGEDMYLGLERVCP